jgi:response regulator RpfG family c-di-GMP phosphodiesterase
MESKSASSERPSSVASILVVERDEAIRTALATLLEGEGYHVIETETLLEAEPLIDNSPEPMVLIVGDADGIAHDSLQFFTAIAANPVTQHAYLYLTGTPRRERLPGLIEAMAALADPTIDRPYELASFLAVVAHAAEHFRG